VALPSDTLPTSPTPPTLFFRRRAHLAPGASAAGWPLPPRCRRSAHTAAAAAAATAAEVSLTNLMAHAWAGAEGACVCRFSPNESRGGENEAGPEEKSGVLVVSSANGYRHHCVFGGGWRTELRDILSCPSCLRIRGCSICRPAAAAAAAAAVSSVHRNDCKKDNNESYVRS
jgi:hypothetical protein